MDQVVENGGVHVSHNVIRGQEGTYCVDCAEWSTFVLALPCKGEPHTGNVVLPHHLPRGAIIRAQ